MAQERRSNPRTQPHLAGLDLLRVGAILLVVLFHYPHADASQAFKQIAAVGWAGVEAFFVLSGFLIGSQILEPVSRGLVPSARRFYLRRAFRILPSFLVVLGLYLAWPGWSERPFATPAWRFVTFTQNFGLHWEGFSHAWSLCVEEHFYLVLPWAVLAVRRLRAPFVVGIFAALMLAGVLLRGTVWGQVFSGLAEDSRVWDSYNTLLYYPSYARLDGLVCGVALASVRTFRPRMWSSVVDRPGRAALLGVFFLSAGLSFSVLEQREGLASTLFAFPLVSLGFSGLLVALAHPGTSAFCARIPGVGALATGSFAIYLVHKAVQHAVHEALAPLGIRPLDGVAVLLCVPAVLFAAAGLHFAIERPALRLRQRWLQADRV